MCAHCQKISLEKGKSVIQMNKHLMKVSEKDFSFPYDITRVDQRLTQLQSLLNSTFFVLSLQTGCRKTAAVT